MQPYVIVYSVEIHSWIELYWSNVNIGCICCWKYCINLPFTCIL